MARAELEGLYRNLVESRFSFVPRCELHLRGVYSLVKGRYPELCDDTYLCSTNCKSGINSPEWMHTVRTGLNEMKKRGELVATGSTRGMWRFGSVGAVPASVDETEAIEGRVLLRLHKGRERKSRLIARKKREVLRSTDLLACEACGFDFAAVYGELGAGFAECHHRQPLADTGETRTTLTDLAIVCANCHRMLHRRPWRTVEELRALIQARCGS